MCEVYWAFQLQGNESDQGVSGEQNSDLISFINFKSCDAEGYYAAINHPAQPKEGTLIHDSGMLYSEPSRFKNSKVMQELLIL